jgi:hypothetical protein
VAADLVWYKLMVVKENESKDVSFGSLLGGEPRDNRHSMVSVVYASFEHKNRKPMEHSSQVLSKHFSSGLRETHLKVLRCRIKILIRVFLMLIT